LARFGVDGPQHHAVVRHVVALDDDVVDGELLALAHNDLQIDRVLVYFLDDRADLGGQVAVVLVEGVDVVTVPRGAAELRVQFFLAVHVALFDAKDDVQHRIGVLRVARPLDVAHVVARSLVEADVHVHLVVVVAHHAVGKDLRIAEAFVLHLGDEVFLGLLIFVVLELARPEDARPSAGLDTLKPFSQTRWFELGMPIEMHLMHPDLLVLLHVHDEDLVVRL